MDFLSRPHLLFCPTFILRSSRSFGQRNNGLLGKFRRKGEGREANPSLLSYPLLLNPERAEEGPLKAQPSGKNELGAPQ